MWTLSVPWWEFIVRAVIVYGFIFVLLRLSGKRQVGQLAPFDLVLLLILSNAVQNAMNAGDNSVSGGLILASTLIALNYGISCATFHSKKLAGLIEGRPRLLIHNGVLYQDVLESEKISHHELNEALRTAGCSSVGEVQFAVLENTGKISIKTKQAG